MTPTIFPPFHLKRSAADQIDEFHDESKSTKILPSCRSYSSKLFTSRSGDAIKKRLSGAKIDETPSVLKSRRRQFIEKSVARQRVFEAPFGSGECLLAMSCLALIGTNWP